MGLYLLNILGADQPTGTESIAWSEVISAFGYSYHEAVMFFI